MRMDGECIHVICKSEATLDQHVFSVQIANDDQYSGLHRTGRDGSTVLQSGRGDHPGQKQR
ncbi:hypothetical protein D3C74_402430 [compost metagenome]